MTELVEAVHYRFDGLLRRALRRVDDQISIGRLLVRIRYPSEFRYQPCSRPRIQPLSVAPLTDLERRGYVDEEEIPSHRLNPCPYFGASGGIWRNVGTDGDPAVPNDLGCYVADATNIPGPHTAGYRQPGGPQAPHFVAVEEADGPPLGLGESISQCTRQCGFARSREPSKEDGRSRPASVEDSRHRGRRRCIHHGVSGHQDRRYVADGRDRARGRCRNENMARAVDGRNEGRRMLIGNALGR